MTVISIRGNSIGDPLFRTQATCDQSRLWTLCTDVSNRASTPFHYLNGNNKVWNNKTEVLEGEVGGKLAEQYHETHCVRSPSKRTLWGENLIPLIITKWNLLQTRDQGHQSKINRQEISRPKQQSQQRDIRSSSQSPADESPPPDESTLKSPPA
jgi:hypothetical protein